MPKPTVSGHRVGELAEQLQWCAAIIAVRSGRFYALHGSEGRAVDDPRRLKGELIAMFHTIDPSRDLLFGLLALQNGLINQGQLVAAFQAWTLDKARALADHLCARGDLDAEQRSGVEAMVALHLKKHGGDAERSLAAIPAGRSTRESLARLGDADVEASVAHLGAASTQAGEDADRTASYSVGAATSEGQRFRVLRPHARGGLGAVFVALDTELHREVALKQILDSHADDPTSRQRFLLEAEVTGGLEHPGIVPVYGLGTYGDGRPYYTMRFIRGDSLKEAIERFHERPGSRPVGWAERSEAHQRASASPPVGLANATHPTNDPGRRSLELRKLLRRFLDVCNSIEYAHSRGVLHRDIKPGNVIVGRHGETLVVDWGLAKATGRSDPSSGERTLMPSSASGSSETLPGSALGTPAYMSPEQAEGQLDRLGPRSDVYSLGATLYCLLTGVPPFAGDPVDVIPRVRRGDYASPRAIDPTIDRALEAICLKAMALRPEDRYSSCRALAEDIERWMADEPVTAWQEPLARRARRWARRNRSLVTGAAAALLAGVVGLAAVLAVQTRAKAELARSLANETQANQNLAAANVELARSQAAVQARYDLAVEAIKTFHTGVSEDFLLKEELFKELRDRLLKSASDFYGKLGALLGKESDAASRRALLQANSEVADLTSKVGQSEAALAAHRQVLVAREALASEPGSDTEIKADVGQSQTTIAGLLASTGQSGEALATYRQAEGLLAELVRSAPASTSARSALAACRSGLALLLSEMGRSSSAEAEYRQALALYQKLAEENPAVTQFRHRLAGGHHNHAMLLSATGQPAAAEAAYRRALAISQKLAEENPALTQFRSFLANHHNNLGNLLKATGRPAEAESEYRRALAIRQKLADDNPAVTQFRDALAGSHGNLGFLLSNAGRPAEAEAEFRRALPLFQKLADEHPKRIDSHASLANVHQLLGVFYSENGRLEEGEASLKQALGIRKRLAAEHSDLVELALALAKTYGQMAYVQRSRGDLQGDYDWLTRGTRLLEDILRRAPTYTPARKYLPYQLSYGIKGSARLGRHAEAIADCDRAIALLDGEERDRVRILRVLALARSGDHARAAVEADALAEATTIPVGERSYAFACADALASAAARNDPNMEPAERSKRSEQLAARSMLLLARSRIAGFFRDPAQINQLEKDPDFDSLRSRPDFRALLLDVAFPADPFAPDDRASRPGPA
jgi:serine/threonine-protein kinase